MFALRGALAPRIIWIERTAQIVFFSIPLLGVLARSPALIAVQIVLIVALMGARLAMHLVTLPIELDASFKRALPILEAGKFVPEQDRPAARRVLTAAAYTYVAAALLTLVDVTRFIRILR